MAKTDKKRQEEVKQLELTISDYSYKYDANYYISGNAGIDSKLILKTLKFIDIHVRFDLEDIGIKNFNTIEFMNLLYRQFIEIKNYYDTPLDYITHLNSIPCNKIIIKHLKGMIFKFYIGYIQMNQKTQLATILTLLYDEVNQDFNKRTESGYNYFAFYCDNKDDDFINFTNKDNQIINTTKIIEPIKVQQTTTQPTPPNEEIATIDSTLHQQFLIYHYLFKHLDVSINSIDKTQIARFIQFATQKQLEAKKIQNTSIYKLVDNPFNGYKKDNGTTQTNLQKVRDLFESIGLKEIAEIVSKDIV